MSFELITSTERYLCLSTDVKPTVGIKKSALAKETDTGSEFIFNGVAWVTYSQPVTVNGSLANVLVSDTETLAGKAIHSITVVVGKNVRLALDVKTGAKTELLIQGLTSDGSWVDIEKKIDFYTSVLVDFPVEYDSYKFTVQNIGRITADYNYIVKGWVA